jgi:hypothetical protein
MLSKFNGVFKRNKNKLIAIGAVLGGAYALGCYLKYRVEEMYEEREKDQASKQKYFIL